MLTYTREQARRSYREAMFESCADANIARVALCSTSYDVPTPDASIKRADGRVYHAGSLFAPTLESALAVALACLATDGYVEVTL